MILRSAFLRRTTRAPRLAPWRSFAPWRGLAGDVDWQLHWRRCAKMYRYAPVNAADRFASRVRVGHKQARVTIGRMQHLKVNHAFRRWRESAGCAPVR